ncbi:hypothetical protein Dsin_028719 [Dipteronia sinensis]|uniref:GRF-type domain-containing protein n=1 Tax=Dipteronia sinensis TaxID=43782 RepID=A0AAE0DUI7_9ROSI|nr:hypothetical protein Dsin_028719 [Dipteronia sinensis]
MNDDTNVEDFNPKCLYGISTRRFTSWTDSNLGRRFWSCYNYREYGNCGFFRWSDPSICARSKVIIPGLLRRTRDLEMRLLEINGFEGNDTSVSPNFANEELSSRGAMRRNWFCVVVIAVGIVLFVGKKLLEICKMYL